MTDKQIIIDSVDVSECLHYTGNVNYLTDKNWTCRARIQCTKCEDWSDCYFKRWKRKEQECNQLKVENLSLKRGIEIAKEADKSWISKLKAENERLQKEREKAKNYNLEYGQLLIKATNKNNKLSKTLAEIKEIAKKAREDLYTCESISYADDDLREILQKISEVEDGRL